MNKFFADQKFLPTNFFADQFFFSTNFFPTKFFTIRGWSFLQPGTRSEEGLWGSEIFSDTFMGARNLRGSNYGGAKCFGRLHGLLYSKPWDLLWHLQNNNSEFHVKWTIISKEFLRKEKNKPKIDDELPYPGVIF